MLSLISSLLLYFDLLRPLLLLLILVLVGLEVLFRIVLADDLDEVAISVFAGYLGAREKPLTLYFSAEFPVSVYRLRIFLCLASAFR